MLDQITGQPCANCESAPAWRGHYCSAGCRDEYEGIGDYAEPNYRPVKRTTEPTKQDVTGALFSRSELVEAEALRQWKSEQLPGQVDIWDACAEVAAEHDAVTWPTPSGVLFGAEELRGQLVIA